MIINKQSIRQKLEAIILITAAAVLLLSFFLFMLLEISSARNDADTRLRAIATVLGSNSSAAITFGDKAAATEVLSTLNSQSDVLVASIEKRNGEILANYTTPSTTTSLKQQLLSLFLSNIEIEQPIIIHNELIGYFHITGDMSRAYSILTKQAFLGLGIFIISMLVATLISRKLHHVISDPINHLLNTITAIAADKDVSHRAIRISDDELGTLVNEFNSMLDKLQDYDSELTSYRQDLEQLVIERTKNLEFATKKAQSADQAKSDFLATMSHEIRTPMNAVIGFAGLLQQTKMNETQIEYVHNISSSTESLLIIINDILDFSKIEAGKLELETSDFILKEHIDDIQTLFLPRIEEKDIQLHIVIDPKIPHALHGDSSRLRQILINLLANSIKFTEHGQVKLSMQLAQDASPSTGKPFQICIMIEDTGIGITAEQQAQLFQPFQQGDASITRRYGGTGLGLIITQRLVTMMNGSINISSQPDIGTCFTITIDIQPAKHPEKIQPRNSQITQRNYTDNNVITHTSLSGLSVMVVDDNLLNLKVASTFLSNEGVEVIAVESGAEALQKINNIKFDLILMDLEMPGMSGIETATSIRQAKEYSAIPIIALTAHAFPDTRTKVQAAGMNDLLTKPYKAEQLFSIINKWCNSADNLKNTAALTGKNTHHTAQTYNQNAAFDVVAGDKDVANELLADFLKALPETEQLISENLRSYNTEKLYEAIHHLAGSACIVGAESLHAYALEIMDLLKLTSTSKSSIVSYADKILAEIDKFRKIFES